jgi:Arc/MetJ-type ribon-helix-helix transcriptional regulator
MPGKKTSVYLPDELDRAVRASGRSLPDLIRAGLEAGERSRADRLADAAERMLRKLDEGYELVRRDP